MFLWNLLTSATEGGESSVPASTTPKADPTFWQQYGGYFIFGGLLILLVLWMFWSSRKRRKQQEEAVERINALKPGTKVETIGGVFGTIVEMNAEEGTFVLETGSEKHGKTYIRFDRNAIARIEPTAAPVEPVAPVEEVEDAAPEFAPIAKTEEKAPETEENKD